MHLKRTTARSTATSSKPVGAPAGVGPHVAALPLVGVLVALGAAVVVLAAVAAHVAGIPEGVLFRDATMAARVPHPDGPYEGLPYAGNPYVGAVSILTIVVWGSITTLAAFVAWLWRDRTAALVAGLTATMGTDDALLLHEDVGPRLGVPDLAWPAVYGVVAALLLWRLVRARARGPLLALLVGLAFLGLSLGIDVLDEALLHLTSGWLIVAEDGSKLLGATAWLALPVLLHDRWVHPRG